MTRSMVQDTTDSEGIATLRFDLAGRSTNVLDRAALAEFHAAVERAIADPAVTGVLLASGKEDFIAGADLEMVREFADPVDLRDATLRLHRLLRHMETCGKPFAAAINGTALGGGLELCLACHHRVLGDRPRTRIGLPEVTLGLLPGGGGTQRLPRLIGIQAALPLLLEGRRLTPQQALQAGVVHALVPAGEEEESARRWLLGQAGQPVSQPWDRKGYCVPGGDVQSPAGRQTFMAANAMVRAKTLGNYPAPHRILSCVYEGLQVDMETAAKIETGHFVAVALSPQAKNMMRTLFFHMGEVNRLARRPSGVPTRHFRKVGILGAGTMGAAIAHAQATAGIETVLLDTSVELAARGRDRSRRLLEAQQAKGRVTTQAATATLARLHPTADFADLAGCDLVIEAVVEDRAIKADVTRKAEAALAGDALYASNTSTLPITGLADASARPGNFIGLHFFSPVEKMQLVEVIVGRKTTDKTLAEALDYVRAIGKTPIVVNDARGFYTSRVFSTYVREGLAMLAEGVRAALIENAGRQAGMPVGPLAIADELSLDLIDRISAQTRRDLGADYVPSAADDVIGKMVHRLGRVGRKAGRGFYAYPQEGKKHLWPQLDEHFVPAPVQPGIDSMVRRLLHIQSVEAARCFEEGVITSAADADVGALLGWGYPAAQGGPIGYIDSVGIERFVAECDELVRRYGPRYSVPASLRERAAGREPAGSPAGARRAGAVR